MEIKEFLTNKFKDIFHRDPSYFAFAPGRTNLIGEHLDYNNCPVFPFAIDLRISACFSVRDDNVIRIVDADSVHGERTFEVTAEIPPFAAGDWGNYPKAAVQGIISDGKITVPYRGFDAVIYSTVPAAGGMSSSSAFVVLVSLIFSTANGISYSKMELSALTAVAERYVGTQGGGMDQTASINGIAGKVLKIGFSPLSCTAYPVPEGFSFVVADTLIKARKSKEALSYFNSKPIECRLAAAVLRKKLPPCLKKPLTVNFLGDLSPENTGLTEAEIDRAVFSVLKETGYTYGEIAEILETDVETVQKSFCLMADGTPLPQPENGFALSARTRHVLTEWRRVEQCASAMEKGDAETVGRLMYESHVSCRDNGDFSCSELNALVEAARKAGAVGSRMTGAGRGGCTVSLVRNGDVDSFISRIHHDYYDNYLNQTHPEIPEESKRNAAFVVRPSDGASVFSLNVE